MKVCELIRIMKKNGCKLVRHGNKHDIWINPKTGGEAQVVRHPSKELPTGTIKNILENLGINKYPERR